MESFYFTRFVVCLNFCCLLSLYIEQQKLKTRNRNLFTIAIDHNDVVALKYSRVCKLIRVRVIDGGIATSLTFDFI